MRRVPWKKIRNIILRGSPTCFRCGHKFGMNEARFYLYPPVLGGERVCATCKKKESEAEK